MMTEYALEDAGGVQSTSSAAPFNTLTPDETVKRLVSMANGPTANTFTATKFIKAVRNQDESAHSFFPYIFAVNENDKKTEADASNYEINSCKLTSLIYPF